MFYTIYRRKVDLDQICLSKRLKSEGIENPMEAACEVHSIAFPIPSDSTRRTLSKS